MRPTTILFYVDSAATLAHCIAAAEILRKKLSVRIVMMMVDSDKHKAGPQSDYEVYDYAALFNSRRGFRLEWGGSRLLGKGRLAGGRLAPLRRWLGSARRGMRHPWRLLVGICGSALVSLAPLMFLDRFSPLPMLGKVRGTETWRSLGRLRHWIKSVRGVHRFIRQVKPDAIILPEDNIETLSRAFVTYGLRQNAPTLILPCTIPNPLEPAQFYFDDPRNQDRGLLAGFLTRIWPKWRYVHAGRSLLRLNAPKALAIEALGLSTPAPWILNRGNAKAIILDSDALREHYMRLGFPSDQLRVIGDTHGEVLASGLAQARQRRTRVLAEFSMAVDRPLIVCAFPPDQYHGTSPHSFEYATFEELIDAWMATFHALGDAVNVIVRPHPRLDLSKLRRYEQANVRLSMSSTAELVPIADLYVASISATIRWAIACGVPAINYDCYRYRYGDYVAAEGVAHVERREDFAATLRRFLNNAEFAEALKRKQAAASRHWGVIDDKFAERFATLVAQVASGGTGEQPLLPMPRSVLSASARS